jgi:hypothetical protein
MIDDSTFLTLLTFSTYLVSTCPAKKLYGSEKSSGKL